MFRSYKNHHFLHTQGYIIVSVVKLKCQTVSLDKLPKLVEIQIEILHIHKRRTMIRVVIFKTEENTLFFSFVGSTLPQKCKTKVILTHTLTNKKFEKRKKKRQTFS